MRKVVFLLLCLSLTGCASVVKGRYQFVDFDTIPTGATVVVKYPNSEPQTFRTPVDMKLATGAEPYSVEVSKDGYRSLSLTMDSRLSGWWYVNIAGGLFALGTMPFDLASGAAYTFRKAYYRLSLESVKSK
jgi:hypothetical protein